MDVRSLAIAAALAFVLAPSFASAQCPPSCPVKGGGDASSDCHVELASDTIRLNAPFFNPAKPKTAKEIRCFDGEPGCDLDGVVNNSCDFDVNLCLRNADPELASCTATDVTAVAVKGNFTKFPGLGSLQTAVDALLPATTNVCTVGQSVTIPLKGPTSKGEYKAAKFTFKLAATAGATDADKVKFVCVPHGWPSHGYDGANTRATPVDTKIDSSNVTSLVQKWNFAVQGGKSVTSTVTVGPKMVYTTSWDGKVYGLKKKTGDVRWEFNTNSSFQLGVQSTATLTADGRLLVGDSLGRIYALDAKKGALLWTADVSVDNPGTAHIWSSPTVANGTVYVGVASHNDAPCARGTMYALDLDTGAQLWSTSTVPEKVCFDDTSVTCNDASDCAGTDSPCLLGRCDSNPDITCTVNADCPAIFLSPGTCVTAGECWLDRATSCTTNADCSPCNDARGGGITATAAISADARDLYMASVGCLSFPSVGSSDSIFRVDAATGAITWTHRTRTPEQFKTFPGGPAYQDYGFLNGPILAEVDDGLGGTVAVAAGGGKDGTLYAVDQATGLAVWTNQVATPPVFAAFGLFNGAPGYDVETDRFLASLFSIDTYPSSNDHLVAFDGNDGMVAWSDQIGTSWGDITVANDLVFVGTQSGSSYYAYDKHTGTRLHTITVPGGTVMGGAAVENGVIYIPYGDVFGGPGAKGGVLAMEIPAP